MHVVCTRAGVASICLLVASYARQYTQIKQAAADRNELAALVVDLQREGEPAGRQHRLGGEQKKPLAQNAQRDLRIGAFKHRTCQTEKYIATAIIVGQAPGVIEQVRGPFVESGAIPLYVQDPARFPRKPFPQTIGMSPNRREFGVRRGHEWRHQKRPQGAAEFLLEVLRLLQPDIVAVRARRLAGDRVCRTDRALRSGLQVDGWCDEIHVSASVEVTVSK